MITSILIVHQHLIFGGAEKYTLNLANSLADKNITVTLITGDGPLSKYVSKKVNHYIMPISRLPAVRARAENVIYKIAKKHKVQIIHTQCRASMLNSQRARTKLNIPLISHEHHMYFPHEYAQAVEELQNGADKITTSGPYTTKSLIKHGLRMSITSIINGIDVTNIHPISQKERADARTRLKLDKDDKVVLCISRLEPGKGIDKLVLGFIQVAQKIPQAKLIIVGNDATNETLSLILHVRKQYKLDDKVFYYPGEYDIRKYHAAADVFCYPALAKGMAVVEAMAAGLPVVGKKTIRKPLVVVDQVSGLMTKPSARFPIDPDQIAEKLDYLLERPLISRSMGKLGRQKILREFTLPRVIAEVLQVYADTLGAHSALNIASGKTNAPMLITLQKDQAMHSYKSL